MFDGECEAAFHFYAACLGGTIVTMLTYGQSPLTAQAPPEWRDKILHATLRVGEATLAGVDALTYAKPVGFFVLLDLTDASEAERIFAVLSEGGTVAMPLTQTFWAARFGVVTDRFGIPWEINCSS